ncbi:endonuclease domain-containing protein [Mesorhizobium sp. AaZ16]|uniref:endonuclease domain-containing protein n=1 Tax=Mesorhizobium sp. AaZ16 TaxID=3402289 RepID=UPI00374E9A5E
MRAPVLTFKRATKLRRDMSLPEVILWEQLRRGGLDGMRFRRQHPVGPYVLDFYCAASRLAVEVDGAVHDLLGQTHHDICRDAWLAGRGIRTLRIAASDVLEDQALEGVLVMIAEAGKSDG